MPTFESKASSCKVRRKNMWRKYHSIKTTPEYKALWEQFLLKSINSVASPTFYQYATDVVFRQLIQEQFPLPRRSAEVLFRMLVGLFVNFRGFAFTSTWMEQYKQTMKKGLQRSKALRREVCFFMYTCLPLDTEDSTNFLIYFINNIIFHTIA